MNRGEIEVNNNAKKGGGRYPGTLLGQKHLLYDEKNFFCGTSAGKCRVSKMSLPCQAVGTRLGFSFFTLFLAFLFPTAEPGPRLIVSARSANLNTDNTCRIRLIILPASGFNN